MTLSAALLALGGCAAALDEDVEPDEVGTAELPIRDAHPAAPDELLGLVSISIPKGSVTTECSGTVIAADTVLTAAHCFCTEDTVGDNSCVHGATVTYRRNPANLGVSPVQLGGTAIIHPDYNPSWTEGQYEHDLAIVKVNGVAPPHVPAVVVPDAYLPTGTIVRIAGFGLTGSDCKGPSGTLNFDTDDIEDYEDGHDIMTFDDFVWCGGDSGGAILDSSGQLFGVISMHTPWTQKAIATASEYEWIQETTCTSPGPSCTGRTSDIVWRRADGTTMIWSNAVPGNSVVPGAPGNDWQIQGLADFDGNGRDDILWRSTGGDNVIWSDGVAPGSWIAPVGTWWSVVGTGDFEGDGRSDILWRSVWGDNVIWSSGIAPGRWISPVDNGWRVAGVGDFTGDGQSDILWRSVHGDNVIWPSGNAPGFWIWPLNDGWQVAGVGDFDGNGDSDILWRCLPQAPATACGNAVAGTVAIWQFWYGNYYGYTSLPGALDRNWQIQGVGDFDGNGNSDILWRCLPPSPGASCGNAPNGSAAIWHDADPGWTTFPGMLGTDWLIQGAGRFDG